MVYRLSQTSCPSISVNEQTIEKAFRALKYNDTNQTLTFVENALLPNIPGELSIISDQIGSNYALAFILKPIQVDTADEERIAETFLEQHNLQQVLLHPEKGGIEATASNLHLDSRMTHRIGAIRFTQYPGFKEHQMRRVYESLCELVETGQEVFGDDFEFSPYSSEKTRGQLKIQIKNIVTNEVYDVGLVAMGRADNYDGSMEGLIIKKTVDSPRKKLTTYERFKKDFLGEIRVIHSFMSWLYQNAKAETDKNIPLNVPDKYLLDWLVTSKFLEVVKEPENRMSDLGGYKGLRTELLAKADRFVKSYNGLTGLKPDLMILYGRTGIGKTSMMNGIASRLLSQNIPVYLLKGSETFAEALKGNLAEIKKLFFYMQINGGALFIRDFDALIGTRVDVEYKNSMESILLTELQKLKEEKRTWLVADTQFIGKIPAAIVNAHRIGDVIELPLEMNQSGVEDIIVATIRKADSEVHKRCLTFEDVRSQYVIDYIAVATRIIELGGMIPAQIEKAVRDEITSKSDRGYILDTESLLQRVEQYFVSEEHLQALRNSASFDELNSRVTKLEQQMERLKGENQL